ncbi:MAG: xanthine dehydrogenase accessory factor [Chitinophagales bacterium]
MHSADRQVIEQIDQWLQAVSDCWLCTIIATKGSSPRPVGSLLAINSLGASCGSVSGGCIEDDIAKQILNQQLPISKPSVLSYGIDASENERLGLPCGGELKLLVQPIVASTHNQQQFKQILSAISQRKCISRESNIDDNFSTLTPTPSFHQLDYSGDKITHCFGPHFQMLLIGAGQLSKVLAELALAMDYKVIVCDPRPELIEHWDVDNVEAIFDTPDQLISKQGNDLQSVIISLTHVNAIDDLAIASALKTDAFYVGALGSMRTSDSRRQRLLAQGFNEQQLNRLHAPVGLFIGSKTPLEIAVSIMAELTSLRAAAARKLTPWL